MTFRPMEVAEFPAAQAEIILGALAQKQTNVLTELMATIETRRDVAEVAIALANELADYWSKNHDGPLIQLPWGVARPAWTADPGVIPLANTTASYAYWNDRDGVLAAWRTPSKGTCGRALLLLGRAVNQVRAARS